MEFSAFDSMVSVITLVPLVGIFVISARTLPLGPLSLPCITVLTSVMYFYLLPIISLGNGVSEYLGMYLTSLRWTHFLILLYTVGAGVAFFVQRRTLFADLSSRRRDDKPMNMTIYYGL